MAEITRFIPGNHQQAGTPVRGVRKASAPPPKGYRDSEDVMLRANVLNEKESPAMVAALRRLDSALSNNQPLRGDVPRGFYLNIRV